MGVKPNCNGFWVNEDFLRRANLSQDEVDRIRPYVNGRDLVQKSRGIFAIDLYGFDSEHSSKIFPNLYQYLLDNVRPTLEAKRGTSPDNDQYADRWWQFAKTRPAMRKALEGLSRYIATTETAKHRTFQTVSSDILPDQKVRVIAVEDTAILAVLSSRLHVTYSDARGNRQGVGNDPVYTHSTCFDPFPFPDLEAKPELKARLDALGERLDSFRKERLEAHDFLTMTKLYNVLERVRALEAGPSSFETQASPAPQDEGQEGNRTRPHPEEVRSAVSKGGGVPPLTEAERDIYEAGLVGVLKDIHDQIDAAVAEAYGWPADLEEEEILSRLVALNHERAAEEARGIIRWLRPEFQNPDGRAARVADEQVEMDVGVAAPEPSGPRLPEEQGELARSVRALVAASATPLSARDIASRFAGKNTKAKIGRVEGMLSILAAIGQAEATDDGRWFSAG
ncbi:MAG: type IIL restriction-modification enzyme MmeI [Glycocaulis sp.]